MEPASARQLNPWRRGEETWPRGAAAASSATAVETVAERALSLRLEWKQRQQTAFGLNSRHADDAILQAYEVIASQRELIPVEIAETEAKRDRTGWKRKANVRKAARLEAAGRTDEAAAARRAIVGQEPRLAQLDAKLAEYRRHQADHTSPRVVFGGECLWGRLWRSTGPEHARLRVEWHAARRGPPCCRWDAARGGHQNPRVTLGGDGGFTLSVVISHLSEKTGHSAYVRQEPDTYSEAPQVTGRLCVPRKHESRVWDLVLPGRPYAVGLRRSAAGRWRAHLRFTPARPEPVPGQDRGVVAVDLNPHGVAIATVGRDGNPEPWSQERAERLRAEVAAGPHKHAGEPRVGVARGRIWLHALEMWQAGADRANLAVDMALEAGKPLAREDLGFAKEYDTNRAFNRYSGNFPYSELAEGIDRRAGQFGVPVVLVDPYTSVGAGGAWRGTSGGRCTRRWLCVSGGRRWGTAEAAGASGRRTVGPGGRGGAEDGRGEAVGQDGKRLSGGRTSPDHRIWLQADRYHTGGRASAAERRHRGQGGPGRGARQGRYPVAEAAR